MNIVARSTAWEWFKLRRRWMPWILLIVVVLFSQLGVWPAYFGYNELGRGGQVTMVSSGQFGGPGEQRPISVECADVMAEPPRVADLDPALVPGLRVQCAEVTKRAAEQLPIAYANFTLPGSIGQAMTTASALGSILIAVLAASTVGVEYSWGTLRTVLVRGTGRWQYLAGKIAVLLLAALAALIVVVGVTAVSSLVAQSLVEAPAGYVAPGWGDALGAIGRAWFGFVPMIALVVLLTVLTSSTAMGMAIGIGYTIAEPLIMLLVGQLSDRVTVVTDYLLAANINGWTGGGAAAFGAAGGLSSLHHFIVLSLYTVVFVALAAWLIESRDVTKATGT